MNPIESTVSLSTYTTSSTSTYPLRLISVTESYLESPESLVEEDVFEDETKNGQKPEFIPQVLKLSNQFFQLLAAIGVSFGASIVGGWLSFSSVAIPKMMKGTTPDDPIQIDLFLGSWIASLFFIGNIIGCLAGGAINQRLGARMAFILSAPLAAVSWIMIAASHHVWVILASRYLLFPALYIPPP